MFELCKISLRSESYKRKKENPTSSVKDSVKTEGAARTTRLKENNVAIASFIFNLIEIFVFDRANMLARLHFYGCE